MNRKWTLDTQRDEPDNVQQSASMNCCKLCGASNKVIHSYMWQQNLMKMGSKCRSQNVIVVDDSNHNYQTLVILMLGFHIRPDDQIWSWGGEMIRGMNQTLWKIKFVTKIFFTILYCDCTEPHIIKWSDDLNSDHNLLRWEDDPNNVPLCEIDMATKGWNGAHFITHFLMIL